MTQIIYSMCLTFIK